MIHTDVVARIWNYSDGDWVFQATRQGRQWKDHPRFCPNEFVVDIHGPELIEQPHGTDLYFGALRSTAQWRGNENFGGAAILFADLDPVDPEGLSIVPSIAWETSPGSFQAVWFLTDLIEEYEEWASLNQRLTRYTGADAGGWMGSKVLRWPGSLNWKREQNGMVPVGRLLWDDGPEYVPAHMAGILPELVKVSPVVVADGYPEPIPSSGAERMLRKLQLMHWDRLNARSRSIITRPAVSDRSFFVAKAVRQLLSEGLTPEETFHLVWVQPWCKWRTDRYAPHILWREIQKAAG